MLRRLLVAALLVLPVAAFAQQLSIDTIMRGYGLSGYSPRQVRWSRDGQRVYFQWKQYGDPTEEDFDTYVVGRDGKGLRKLSREEAKDAPPAGGTSTRDRKRTLFVDAGDLHLYDHTAGKRRALTQTTEPESNARFTRDERHVAFVRGGNLFVLSLEDGSLVQRTNIVKPDERGQHVTLFDDKNKRKTDSQKWIEAEQKKLSDVLARRGAEREEDEAERKAELALEPLRLEARQTVTDLQLSGDEKYVVAFLSTDAERAKKTIVPSYVTESAYVEDLTAREKVGDQLAASKVGILSTTDGKVQWLKYGIPAIEKQKQGETKAATNTEEGQSTVEKTEKKGPADRDVRAGSMIWSEDRSKALLPLIAADNKEWWLLAFDPATAKTRILYNEKDEAWVRWPFSRGIGFLPDNETVWFLGERTGWLHLYTIPYAGGEARALTSGKWEVDSVALSDDRKFFHLTTSEESPFEDHFYRMALGGGAMTKLTSGAGLHDATPSPDGTLLADVYSYTNRPPELFIGKTRVTTSPAPEFASYAWLDVPIVHVPARDGAQVPARIYKPANWNGGPAVIFVHGAGYLQNVHRGWSTYFREYFFHHFLMERGYLVLDLDFRASAGYGRDWRTAIYRHMGGVDLNDHIDAAHWLAREHKVDAKRIGIYGGSYGGFITLMAMFTTPGEFAAGAALRPVTDWAHYNHGYTSNILNTPQDDPEAYRKSSPIYFAEGLQGALLICHGVIDVNVHFQDSVRLAQRLIELRKENWELAMYPLEDHTFVEPTSWADEYKRIFKLFEAALK
jgi:dipeptidyl aminopeptidase/acylaminoacyl peptidase